MLKSKIKKHDISMKTKINNDKNKLKYVVRNLKCGYVRKIHTHEKKINLGVQF